MRRISAREAFALMGEGYLYLDVRSPPEFEAGHPVGAYNIPFEQPGAQGPQRNPRFVAEVEAAFGKRARLILGCESGVRSVRAAELLEASGFQELLEQRAGMGGVRDAFGRVTEKGYRAEGLPLALGPGPALPER